MINIHLTEEQHQLLVRGLNELSQEYFTLMLYWNQGNNMEIKEECEKRYNKYEQLLHAVK